MQYSVDSNEEPRAVLFNLAAVLFHFDGDAARYEARRAEISSTGDAAALRGRWTREIEAALEPLGFAWVLGADGAWRSESVSGRLAGNP